MEIRREYEPKAGWNVAEWEDFLKRVRGAGGDDHTMVGTATNEDEPYVWAQIED
ncbi:hypothetical protein M3G43_02750 [Brevibacterium casei]|uniref:hypothetical protein n=1 Tax=Brevibacterium casei TaxID=33889 RepID=UPI00223C02A2|nr:hypothetical protein [Brevibacterium casei]MCT1446183.1 hypothetical protein [Brevibacterium casei]